MKRLVLVVEDEAPLRSIYEKILGTAGYEVIQAADGAEALALLSQLEPEIVILDMLLPKVDGARVLEYVRTAPHLQHTGVVIATAHNRFRAQHNLAPNDLFLLKPIRPHELIQATQQVLMLYGG